MKAIAVDMGGTNLKVALVDKKEGIIEKFSTPTGNQDGVEKILDRIADSIMHVKGDKKVVGIGIGLPGMVNAEQTKVMYPPNFKGWEIVNVSQGIESRTQLNCKVENDANIAALGSLHFGVGDRFGSFMIITLGTGVGGGIVFNRKLYKGVNGMAGEIGHTVIKFGGRESNGITKGSVEAYLGQRFMSQIAAEEIVNHPDNNLYKRFKDNFDELEPKHLSEEALSGNKLAERLLADAGKVLGYAIINYAHILDINKFVLSGGVAKAGDLLFNPAREVINEQMMIPFRKDFELVYEDLGNDGALLGAAGLAFDSFS